MELILRDDDFGWDYARFRRLHALCAEYGFPLSAAAIPSECKPEETKPWCTQPFLEITAHGFAHENYQTEGKKGEFFTERNVMAAKVDLERTHALLSEQFGEVYFPLFIPPWNRIREEIVAELPKLGYLALSRFGVNKFSQPFPEFNSQVDLHTRKVGYYSSVAEILEDSQKAWQEQSEAEPRFVSLMLHHTKMDDFAFAQMEDLLKELRAQKILGITFKEQFKRWESWYAAKA